MLKKNFFKSYAIIIALAAILILPVLVNAQAQKGSADGSPPSMEKCMRVTGGDQAKCAAKMAAIKARAMDGRAATLGNAPGPKGSPLCNINKRHLTKKAKKARKKRCR
jgi:hypothetical protein